MDSARSVRESNPQKARRYRNAIAFISNQPDDERLWPIARTALAYVLAGSDIDNAWRDACQDYGLEP